MSSSTSSSSRALARGYLWRMGGVLAALAALTALFNALVDPYGYFAWVWRPGFNVPKARPDHGVEEVKIAGALRMRPDALIMGNSRAEIGFDPRHPAWRQRGLRAYNFAVPGAAVLANYGMWRSVEARVRPKVVVIGVEFLDFLVSPDSPVGLDERSGWDADLRLRRARLASVLTLDACADSLDTLLAQVRAHPAVLTAEGFNPLQDYVPIARREGYRPLFQQRAQENARVYVRRPRTVFGAGGEWSAPLEALRRLVTRLRAGGAEVHLAIYPYHAQVLLLFEQAGLWPAFEQWKRALVDLAEAARAAAPGRLELWDFSGYTAWTSEPIPAAGDRKTELLWYWEGGHFKKALGDVMLDRMLGAAGDADFGVRLDAAGLPAHLAALRAQRARYVARQPDMLSAVRVMIERARGS